MARVPEMTRENFSYSRGIESCPNCFISFARLMSLYSEEYVCVYIYIYLYIHM